MLSSMRIKVKNVRRWLKVEHGGIMDEFIVTTGMWIFATIVVLVLAGLIWSALSGDATAMSHVLSNLF
jgi:hypothetical protein